MAQRRCGERWSMDELLTKRLQRISAERGADLFGVVDARDFSSFTGKRNPLFYVDNAKSVIVIGYHMTDRMLDFWMEEVDGKRYCSLVNEILGNIAHELISILLQEGHAAVLSPYSGVYTKDAAVLAGLGVIGENNLLLTEKFGPRVRLRAIITEAHLARSPRKQLSYCDGCPRSCWSACPANALTGGHFSRKACTEHSEAHARRLRDHSFLSCRECELACPVGREQDD